MRVEVHDLAAAQNTHELQNAKGAARETDARVDGVVAALRQQVATDPATLQDLETFAAGLARWRGIRDTQVLAAARRQDSIAARGVVIGPLSDADDAFAAPLDHMVDRIEAQVAPAVTGGGTAVSRSPIAVLVPMALGIGVAGFLSVLTIRSILRPLRRVITVLARLAEGDLNEIAGIDSSDEMGTMAQALDRALARLRATIQALASNAQTLAGASEELSANSTQIASAAQETSTEVEVASGAVQQ